MDDNIYLNTKSRYDLIKGLMNEVEKVIVGKNDTIGMILTAMFAGGHILIEDVPGTGKTTLAMALAKAVSLKFRRVQFTPDVMASDITGFTVYNKSNDNFEYKNGLIMSNIFIADEINRTSPKTQSALLECMEEGKVTVDGVTYMLPTPFTVIATENELGYVGTYPLPEAQLDRFLIKLTVGYPDFNSEIQMLKSRKEVNPLDNVAQVCTARDILLCMDAVKHMEISESVYKYIVDIITASRSHQHTELGASPRASLALMKASQSYAFMNMRDYVTPEDVARMTPYVLSHRMHLTQEAKMKHIATGNIIRDILGTVKVPFTGAQEK